MNERISCMLSKNTYSKAVFPHFYFIDESGLNHINICKHSILPLNMHSCKAVTPSIF